jgi:pSer/pThr/pTyr-binding forkhead associated (FHA) protein
MAITCDACGYENVEGTEFCEACGSELTVAAPEPTPSTPPTPEPSSPEPEPDVTPPQPESSSPEPEPAPTATATPISSAVKLVAKQPNAPISEFPIEEESAVIGIFDPDSGPVEIDLEEFPGSDTVSRQHAEIYQENGIWKIQDLGSTNGIFLKPSGQRRFGARITQPEALNPGDEVAIAKIRFVFQTV